MADNIVLNYVWINGFRGLNNVGFNLGGEYRYKMQQDGAGNYELTQTENEKYVEGFFSNGKKDNNISLVSAIVGNNGAGKTSFIEALRAVFSGDARGEFDYVLIYTDSDNFIKYYSSLNRTSFIISQSVKMKVKFEYSRFPEKISSIFYSSMIDASFYPPGSQIGIEPIGRHFDVSSNWLSYTSSRAEEKREDTKRQIAFVKDNERFRTAIEHFFPLPKRMTLYGKTKKVFERGENAKGSLKDYFESLEHFNEWTVNKKIEAPNLISILEAIDKLFNPYKIYKGQNTLLDEINARDKDKNRKEAECILLEKLFLDMVSSLDNSDIDKNNKIEQEASLYVKDILSEGKNVLYSFDPIMAFLKSVITEKLPTILGVLLEKDENVVVPLWRALENTLSNGHINDKQINAFSFDFDSEKFDGLKYCHEKFTEFLTEINCKLRGIAYSPFENTFSFLSFDWNMSTGEKLMFNLFSRFHYAKEQMDEKDKSSVLILIDEGELGFHLEWQRKYIDALVQVLPLIFGKERPLQIIFTTHSPVSLSDIPRDNVVFLNKKDVVEVVDDPIETFGANIHAIVRNGFFLEDGAMGEFAKKKITKLITELKELKNISDEKIEAYRRRIAMVDEPILRQGLDRLLMEKCTEKKEGKEQEFFMQKQVEFYQRELKRVQELNTKKEHDQNN